jgi:hypothetical protein
MLSAVIAVVCDSMRPGATFADLDAPAGGVLGGRGLGDHHVNGIGLGIGLRFEVTPASTITPLHRNIPLREGMTICVLANRLGSYEEPFVTLPTARGGRPWGHGRDGRPAIWSRGVECDAGCCAGSRS